MGSCEQALIREFPNGETHLRSLLFRGRSSRAQTRRSLMRNACLRTSRDQKKVFMTEYIGHKSEPGELKHLSTRRKGHQRDSVSSGERTRTRPVILIFEPERFGTIGLSG